MCAVADLPTPRSISGAMVVVFRIFPVYMNVFAAESGSWSKAKAACCAATKALVVLMLKSRVKSAKERESGFFGSFRVAAPALGINVSRYNSSVFLRVVGDVLTVIHDHTWETEQCFDFRKYSNNRFRI